MRNAGLESSWAQAGIKIARRNKSLYEVNEQIKIPKEVRLELP